MKLKWFQHCNFQLYATTNNKQHSSKSYPSSLRLYINKWKWDRENEINCELWRFLIWKFKVFQVCTVERKMRESLIFPVKMNYCDYKLWFQKIFPQTKLKQTLNFLSLKNRRITKNFCRNFRVSSSSTFQNFSFTCRWNSKQCAEN